MHHVLNESSTFPDVPQNFQAHRFIVILVVSSQLWKITSMSSTQFGLV